MISVTVSTHEQQHDTTTSYAVGPLQAQDNERQES